MNKNQDEAKAIYEGIEDFLAKARERVANLKPTDFKKGIDDELGKIYQEEEELKKIYQINGIEPPTPQDTTEALGLLKNYHGRLWCCYYKKYFINTFYQWDKLHVTKVLDSLESFIDKTELEGDLENTEMENLTEHGKDMREYQMLKKGYYLKFDIIPPEYVNGNSRAARIYGLYFLFYDFLQSKVKNDDLTVKHPQPKGNKKTLRFTALKMIYERKPLPDNASKKLKQHYANYSQKNNRTSCEGTSKKRKNKIELFESVVKALPKDRRSKANDELSALKKCLNEPPI